MGIPTVPGTPDTSVQTALPPLPQLQAVQAVSIGDSVSITVEPVEGALDYRVYPLPADGDISAAADGHVTIKNAVYRCSGDRQSPVATADNMPPPQSSWVKTLVDNQTVGGVKRTLADATLGFVYVTPGDGRTPVYAMGNPADGADNGCFQQRWAASRVKRYVTSDADRAMLLASRWRDDGIAFYVPTAASANTRDVLSSLEDAQYYFIDGPEAKVRKMKDVAFHVLTARGDADTRPLMRVFYSNGCGLSHDELVAGQPRFDRARFQGDKLPLFDLHWSGLTGPTTLVVEALDTGCPFQGTLAPTSDPPTGTNYPKWLTLDDMHAASASGEIFINGQHPATNTPKPIARSFVKVAPAPPPTDFDWFMGFGPNESLGTLKDTVCGEPAPGTCWQQFRTKSDVADMDFLFVENRFAALPVLGELWVAYADFAADTGGKFRLTPTKKGQISADTFLHVTMGVDSFTTGRRYPQMLISDQDAPINWTIDKGNTIIVQTFMGAGTASWPNVYEVEVCDHRSWDVNNQCPNIGDLHYQDGSGKGKLAPNAEVGEHTGVDRTTTFDAYLSTTRAYLFLDGEPYGCMNLPTKGVPSGAVSVTFGDVLYHSGVDNGVFAFHEKLQKIEAHRHFDNLGYKSGVAAPTWDEGRLPCVTAAP